METINIKIPSNLTHSQEVQAIVEHLGKKFLHSNNKLLEIGAGYEISHLQTQIIITREPVEVLTVTRVCPICECVFDQTLAKILWTNYGGKQKKHFTCSDDCRNSFIDFCGDGRASISKRKLTPIFHMW